MVFVEYESEVEEERGRVVALLDKLRIDGETHVFSLASGLLNTYEMIVNGRVNSPDVENTVNECLRDDEWWDDLQAFRGSSQSAQDGPEEFPSIAGVMGSAAAAAASSRPAGSTALVAHGQAAERKRASTILLGEIPRKSTVSNLARLGVNMGIHTQNLSQQVLDDSEVEHVIGLDSDSDSSSDESAETELDEAESVVSEGGVDDVESVRRPLLAPEIRRRSVQDILGISGGSPDRNDGKGKRSVVDAYGTMSRPAEPGDDIEDTESTLGFLGPSSNIPSGRASGNVSGTVSARSLSPEKAVRQTSRPERPSMSRQGSSTMKFSSLLIPETKVMAQAGSEPKMMFTSSDASPTQPRGRPPLSRQSSAGQFSSRPLPETRVTEGRGDIGPSVTFAEPAARSRKPSPAPRQQEEPETEPPTPGDDDARIDIPALLLSHTTRPRGDDEGGSDYSTQGTALSFNDLPSRAQHLILNELLRQNSDQTAVLFTTLPIPEEGTCQSEEDSIRYLSDVELLCNNLPPVLLVLSNNMTFTVSL